MYTLLHRPDPKQNGYTMIELVVVISILGLVAAIVLPMLLGFMNRGKTEAALAEQVIVQKAVHQHMIDQDLQKIDAGTEPVQLMAGQDPFGENLDTNTGWTYTWDENGLVAQGPRVG